LNNDGVVDNTDLALFAQTYNTRAVGGRPNGRQYNPMMDFNNDQAVNPLDLWIFKVWFFSSEGPGPGAIDQTDDPQLAYIHFEHRGAPVAVSDQTGGNIWQAHYQPFGEIEEQTDVDGDGEAFALNLRYPGQYHDRESGYYYNYFRDYDPTKGRYLQGDRLNIQGQTNDPQLLMLVKLGLINLSEGARFNHLYTYAVGNPVMFIDPLGLDWIYSQSSGQMSHQPISGGPPAPVSLGYSGNGIGLNNPSLQSQTNTGPIPQGTYDIGAPHSGSGPVTIPLIPDPLNNMYGRNDFAIHGDNSCMCNSASQGCIILPRNIRQQMINSGDYILRVIP
ncbi:MAG: RHS repeat-associated core domain-containing protein, partial [Candidatus Thiodiazotropha endolucinida]